MPFLGRFMKVLQVQTRVNQDRPEARSLKPGVVQTELGKAVCVGVRLGPLAEPAPHVLRFTNGGWSSVKPTTVLPASNPIEAPGELASALSFAALHTPRTGGQALRFGNLEFLPHQMRPLVAMGLGGQRCLVADEVGTGKTIAAGYVIAERLLSKPNARIVVLCPASLIPKWRSELRRRFGISAMTADGSTLARLVSSTDSFVAVCSMDAARRFQTAKGHQIDLLVVDEAHHLIGRSGMTLRRSFGMQMSGLADGVLLLTATPVQLEASDLARVLAVLFPAEVASSLDRLVSAQAKWVQAIRQEQPGQAKADLLGALEILKGAPESDLLRSAASRLESALAAQNPASEWDAAPLFGNYTRTRKNEVGLERERQVLTITVVPDQKAVLFGPPESRIMLNETQLLAELDQFFTRHFSMTHRLMLASSRACAEAVLRAGAAGQTSIHDIDLDDGQPKLDAATREECKRLLAKSSFVSADSKYEALADYLARLQSMGVTRVLVFTQWRPTVQYLTSRLSAAGWNAWGLDSETPLRGRVETVERFSHAHGPSVIVCTDVLAEGIDLVAAGAVVNYDLPFNPQLLEQRIGRIDRIGQTSPTVHIGNLVMQGTVEERIHDLLVRRLRCFNETLGGMEEVLQGALEEGSNSKISDAERVARQARDAQEVAESLLVVPQKAFGIETGRSEGLVREAFEEALVSGVQQLASALGADFSTPSSIVSLLVMGADAGESIAIGEDFASVDSWPSLCRVLDRPNSPTVRKFGAIGQSLYRSEKPTRIGKLQGLPAGLWKLKVVTIELGDETACGWLLTGEHGPLAVEPEQLVAAIAAGLPLKPTAAELWLEERRSEVTRRVKAGFARRIAFVAATSELGERQRAIDALRAEERSSLASITGEVTESTICEIEVAQ